MRIRQAKKIVRRSANGEQPPINKVYRALRTVWHRSRHKNGKRMGGSVSNKSVNDAARALNSYVENI